MKSYKIKKGNHRPNFWWLRRLFGFRFVNSANGKVRKIAFDESWRKSDPESIHKVVGFSNGFNHHYTSCRLGAKYNPLSDKMDLFVYYYISGVRGWQKIGEAEFGKQFEFKLSYRNNVFEGSYYAYELNRRSNIVDGKNMNRVYVPYKLKKFGWFLGLYHGGRKPAEVDLYTYSDKYL